MASGFVSRPILEEKKLGYNSPISSSLLTVCTDLSLGPHNHNFPSDQPAQTRSIKLKRVIDLKKDWQVFLFLLPRTFSKHAAPGVCRQRPQGHTFFSATTRWNCAPPPTPRPRGSFWDNQTDWKTAFALELSAVVNTQQLTFPANTPLENIR